ncbi:MAG: hypothetical protein AB1715_14015, partial [Acidobacteriota bacterium]
GAAVGLPTFFVRSGTRNHLLQELLALTKKSRPSRRYPGYVRVHQLDYAQALLAFLRINGQDLIENYDFEDSFHDLSQRLENPDRLTARGRLCRGILDSLGVSSCFEVEAGVFNQAAENYYRLTLRQKHLAEAWAVFENDLAAPQFDQRLESPLFRQAAQGLLGGGRALVAARGLKSSVVSENASPNELIKTINLLLLDIRHQALSAEQPELNPLSQGDVNRAL